MGATRLAEVVGKHRARSAVQLPLRGTLCPTCLPRLLRSLAFPGLPSMTGKLSRLLGPGIMATAMLAALLALGTWQVERLHWKLGLPAQSARPEPDPAVPLQPDAEPFTKVQVTGTLRGDLPASYGADVRDTPV